MPSYGMRGAVELPANMGPSFQLPFLLPLLVAVQGIMSRCVLVSAGKKAAGAYALSIQGEPMQYVEDLMEDNGVHRGR
jgi:hypothetical protein